MKRTVKKTLAALLALCMVMALLPTSFINVAAAGTHELGLVEIYPDAPNYGGVRTIGNYEADDEVIVQLLPMGESYIVEEIYFTASAGDAFTEIVDVSYIEYSDNVYMVFMPDMAVDMHIVYRSLVHDVTINHIYGSGSYDDFDYSVSWLPCEEYTDQLMSIVPPYGYEVDEIIFTATTDGGAFAEVIDVNYGQVDENTWMFNMPACDVTVNVIYKDISVDISYISIMANGEIFLNYSNNVDVFAEPGEDVYFSFETYLNDSNGIKNELSEVYAVCNAGAAFSEAVEVRALSENTYFFVAPEEDVTVYVIYKLAQYSISSQNIFTDGNVDDSVYYNGDEDAEVGDKVIFSVNAPDGYAVEEVYVTCEAGDAFAESIDVISIAGAYSFIMPEGDVTVSCVFKPVVFEVNGVSYIGDTFVENVSFGSWNAGDTVVITPVAYDKCVVEEVIITAESGVFQEIVDFDKYGEAYVFEMPEGNVTVNVTYKENLFNVDIYTYIGDNGDTSWSVTDVEAGSEYVFTVLPPEGYVVDEVIAVANAGGLFYEIIPVSALSDDIYSIMMPAADVTINVVYKSSLYDVTVNFVDAEGNVLDKEVFADVSEGSVFIADLALEGYLVDEIFVYTQVGNFSELFDGYTVLNDSQIAFEMADSDMTVTVVCIPNEFSINATYVENETTVIGSTSVVAAANETAFFNANLEGYTITEIYFITDEGAFGEPINFTDLGNGYYSFPMPTSDVNVTIYVEKITVEVVLPEGEGFTIIPDANSTNPVPYGGSYSFTVDFDESLDADSVVVKANGEVITPVEGVYTVENITGQVYVTFQGALAPNVYTVKFNYFNGDKEVVVSNSVISGSDVVAPTDTYRYGYTFLGWFDNAEGAGEAVTDFTNVTANAEYFAVYEATPVADYTFGDYTVTDSPYQLGFKQIAMEVVKNNPEYIDREAYVVVAAQVKDGSTILFYIPVEVVDGAASTTVSIILNSNTFSYADMYLVYDEVDLTGDINWIDIETGIQIG